MLLASGFRETKSNWFFMLIFPLCNLRNVFQFLLLSFCFVFPVSLSSGSGMLSDRPSPVICPLGEEFRVFCSVFKGSVPGWCSLLFFCVLWNNQVCFSFMHWKQPYHPTKKKSHGSHCHPDKTKTVAKISAIFGFQEYGLLISLTYSSR